MLEVVTAAAITISSTTGRIAIDGKLDDPGWQNATEVTEFWETYPGDNVTPKAKTEAFLTYDERNLYVAFKCYDPEPHKIRAYFGDRDQAGQEDLVGISLDTFHDLRREVDFMSNALGIQTDGSYSEDTFYDTNWDTIWSSAGRITDFGYVVEMAIPFKSLRFPTTDVQEWGIILYRQYPREFFYNMQSHQDDRNRNCAVCQLRTLKGLQGVQPGRNLEIIPSVTAIRNDERRSLSSPLEQGDIESEASLSVTWGITSSLTLNATGNPDFSQVEADVMQFEVNRRFALYYPEKRPFFLEGTNFFSTPINAVYTRAIADPSWGVKMTGKQGRDGYGVIIARDEVTNFLIPSNEGTLLASWDQEVMSSVLRYQHDLGRDSMIGVIGTHREGGSYHSSLGGIDGRVRVGKNDFINFQALLTDTKYPSADEHPYFNSDEVDGYGFVADYSHDSRDWHWGLSYEELEPGFRADLGFEGRVDTKELSGDVSRVFRGSPDSFYSRIITRVYAGKTEAFDGTTTDHEYGGTVYFQLPRQTNLQVGTSQIRETYAGTVYDETRTALYLGAAPSKVFSAQLSGDYGDAIDLSNRRDAKSSNLGLNLTLRPNAHINLDFTGRQQRLWIGEGTVYDARLYVARIHYYFNTRAYIRGLLQLQDIDRSAERYSFPVSETDRTLATQLLFTYKINPFTLFYLGYSDNGVEDDLVDLTTTNRSLFMKLSYAFRP